MDRLPLIQVCSECGAPFPCFCRRQLNMLTKASKRWRSKAYLKFVRRLPCSVPYCQETGIEAAHFGPRAAGRKVHDCLAIPLCTTHHRESHQDGRAWEFYDSVTIWQLQTMVAALTSGIQF